MTFAELDFLPVSARVMTYIATVAIAGGVLFSLTTGKAHGDQLVRKQVLIGALLLLISEPLRYALFQLSIAQGDAALAFDPAMRWLGLETPFGQAILVRVTGLGMVLLGIAFSGPIALLGAIVIVASYLVEGHTASAGNRYLLMPLLFLHMLTVHWWLGAFWPLRTALDQADTSSEDVAAMVNRFGQQAVIAVGILLAAGALMLASLVDWQVDLSSAYQQGFLIKLGAFLAILLIAALNKLRLTPLLITAPERGREALRRFIVLEMVVALVILTATAVAISFPPTDH